MDHETSTRRAPRFAIPLWLLYRTAADSRWRAGRTENISRTGVLFRAEQLIEPNTSIELLVAMPAEVAVGVEGTAICRGRIVRAVAPAGFDDRPAIAAEIVACEPAPNIDPRRI